MLAVMEEFVPLFAKAEWDPTEAPEAKEEKDRTDDVGRIAELHFDLCLSRFLTLWAFGFEWLEISRYF